MRFAHLVSDHSPEPRLAVIDGGAALFTDELLPAGPRLLQDLLDGGTGLDSLRAAVSAAGPEARRPLEGLGYAASVLRPPALIAVGLNYSEHASELKLDERHEPVTFNLLPSSLSGHGQTTSWRASLSSEVDYECELGVVIGTAARDVTPEEALEHVFGYTVVNDITARDLQFAEPQWGRCKSFDGFTPAGPVVVTADEIPDPQDIRLKTVVDGLTVQDASTSTMILTVAELVSFLSTSTTLEPGTLIITGSPGGAGRSRTPQLFLTDGTVVTVSADRIGELTTHCAILAG